MPNLSSRPTPPPLPVAAEQWILLKGAKRTLADHVQDLHEYLRESEGENYVRYLNAVHDSDAVEGSTKIDRGFAANMIREAAKKRNVRDVADSQLAAIVKALGVVLHRYGFSPKDRLRKLNGNGAEG